MSITVAQLKTHLTGQLHGGTLNKVRNIEALFERAANNMLNRVDIIDTERTVALTQTIHDDVYNYSLPSDYKKAIDLLPQDNRESTDQSSKVLGASFDLKKALNNKTITIEGQEGTKILRVNWRSRTPKTLNAMNSTTANGTWAVVGSATNLKADTIYKVSGSGSLEFDVVATGDGIKNSTMTQIDFTNENLLGDFYVWVYLPSITTLTSIAARWGTDLTANYWTPTVQTSQADGTAFRVGWNLIKFSWSTATQTGTVTKTQIDSCQITFNTTGALAQIRVDNITCSIGRPFDIKYYSKYLLKNTSGTWISQTTSDNDVIVLDSDAINIYIYECLIECAQQLEGTDSAFDIGFAEKRLNGNKSSPIPAERIGLYQRYQAEYPSQAKKSKGSYFNVPRFGRGISRRRL